MWLYTDSIERFGAAWFLNALNATRSSQATAREKLLLSCTKAQAIETMRCNRRTIHFASQGSVRRKMRCDFFRSLRLAQTFCSTEIRLASARRFFGPTFASSASALRSTLDGMLGSDMMKSGVSRRSSWSLSWFNLTTHNEICRW